MEILQQLIDIVLHLDQYLNGFVQDYGGWVYALLFFVIFAETGLVVAPFLPGDSLLFVAGTVAGIGAMDVTLLTVLLILAAFGGDNTNYWIGRFFGKKLTERHNARLIKPAHVEKTRQFYQRHGSKTIIFARFFPIIRTFAPFLAGIGQMNYPRYLLFSGMGSIAWVSFFVLTGYFFGHIPIIKDNLIAVVMGIIVISLVPAVREVIRHRRSAIETKAP
jgi:membrane-associated protein